VENFADARYSKYSEYFLDHSGLSPSGVKQQLELKRIKPKCTEPKALQVLLNS